MHIGYVILWQCVARYSTSVEQTVVFATIHSFIFSPNFISLQCATEILWPQLNVTLIFLTRLRNDRTYQSIGQACCLFLLNRITNFFRNSGICSLPVQKGAIYKRTLSQGDWNILRIRIWLNYFDRCRTQRTRGLRREPAACLLLGLQVRITPRA